MNTEVHAFFFLIIFFLGICPIVGLLGYMLVLFLVVWFFLRNFHAVLHSGYMNLHSHQQCKKIHFSPYSLEHKFFADFSMMAILIEER